MGGSVPRDKYGQTQDLAISVVSRALHRGIANQKTRCFEFPDGWRFQKLRVTPPHKLIEVWVSHTLGQVPCQIF